MPDFEAPKPWCTRSSLGEFHWLWTWLVHRYHHGSYSHWFVANHPDPPVAEHFSDLVVPAQPLNIAVASLDIFPCISTGVYVFRFFMQLYVCLCIFTSYNADRAEIHTHISVYGCARMPLLYTRGWCCCWDMLGYIHLDQRICWESSWWLVVNDGWWVMMMNDGEWRLIGWLRKCNWQWVCTQTNSPFLVARLNDRQHFRCRRFGGLQDGAMHGFLPTNQALNDGYPWVKSGFYSC